MIIQCVLLFSLGAFQSSGHAEVAVIVHPQSPITQLTSRQVKKIFLGRLRMIPNANIEPDIIDQKETQSTYHYFYTKIINMKPAKLKRYRASYLFSGKGTLPTKLDDNASVLKYVSENRSAIGYVQSDTVDDSVKVVYPNL